MQVGGIKTDRRINIAEGNGMIYQSSGMNVYMLKYTLLGVKLKKMCYLFIYSYRLSFPDLAP